MNILIIGASQGMALSAARAALDKGHRVTAFARSPQEVGAIDHPQLLKVERGTSIRRPRWTERSPGTMSVITASATSLRAFKENPRYFSQGTELTIDRHEEGQE